MAAVMMGLSLTSSSPKLASSRYVAVTPCMRPRKSSTHRAMVQAKR